MRTHTNLSLPIGTVVNIVPSLGNGLYWSSLLVTGPCALRDLYSCNLEPRHVSIKDFPPALLPPNARDAIDELEKALTVAINSETSKQEAEPPRVFLEGLEQLVALSLTERTMFVTENQLIGVRYAGPDSIRPGNVLVELFDINLPFLLRPVDEGEYRIINVAYFSRHRWGHSFVETEISKLQKRQNKDDRLDRTTSDENDNRTVECAENAPLHDLELYGMREYNLV